MKIEAKLELSRRHEHGLQLKDADGQNQSECGSGRGEQQAFGEKLANQALAACPQGQAHRNLFTPLVGARQQHASHVRAAYQQHSADRGHENKGGNQRLAQPGRLGNQSQDLLLVGLGMSGGQTSGDGCQFALCLLGRDAVAKAAEHLEFTILAVSERRGIRLSVRGQP